MSIAYRYNRDINLCKDLLQETFILIFRNLVQFDDKKGTFESWSARILINKTLESKRKMREFYIEDIVDDRITEVEDSVFNRIEVDALKVEIQKLPEIYKVILQLYYFDEYDHTEIGKLLEIKPSSSRSRLTRAKQLITAKWEALQTIANE